ncbi:hypothetical protein ACT7C9_32595 [Bacillus cereus]
MKGARNELNQFEREMTLTVFDMVTQWATWNPTDYPVEVDLERTRVIFSDLVGNITMSHRDNWVDGNPAYVQTYNRGELINISTRQWSRIDNISQTLRMVDGSTKNVSHGSGGGKC